MTEKRLTEQSVYLSPVLAVFLMVVLGIETGEEPEQDVSIRDFLESIPREETGQWYPVDHVDDGSNGAFQQYFPLSHYRMFDVVSYASEMSDDILTVYGVTNDSQRLKLGVIDWCHYTVQHFHPFTGRAYPVQRMNRPWSLSGYCTAHRGSELTGQFPGLEILFGMREGYPDPHR